MSDDKKISMIHQQVSSPPPPPLKLGQGFLVFEIWTKRRVMKKLLRNRGLVERGGGSF